MLRRDPFGTIVRATSRRAWLTIAVVTALAVGGAALALRLEPSADIGTLVDSSSESFAATEEANRVFGDDAVIVLVEGELQNTLLTPDVGKVLALEGCLAGNAPPGDPALPEVCQELAETKPAQVVYGPATFIRQSALELNAALERRLAENQAEADQVARSAARAARAAGASPAEQRQAAESARDAAQAEFEQQLIGQALRYGITTPPAINNPRFVEQLVFTTPVGERIPKARFAGFFPSPDAALIQVRLRPDLSPEERGQAIDLIEEAVAADVYRLDGGGRYVVTGVPVVIDALAAAVERSLLLLLIAAVLVMAGTLAVVFRSPLRLLPLALALAAAGLTYGAVALVGGSLTMASIAALPVLIGLAVDYAIQFQSRFNEVRGGGGGSPPPSVAAPAAASAGGPTITAAGIATAAGFLVLLLSPVPMVRGFALILVLGVALGLACALTAGFAALSRLSGRPSRAGGLARGVSGAARSRIGRRRAYGGSALGHSLRQRLARARARGGAVPGTVLRTAVERPRRVLAIGLALAALGWVLDTQTEVVSDVRELVPQDLQALQDLEALQEATGFSGQIDVTVSGAELTSPEVVRWISDFRLEVLAAHGYEPGDSCEAGPEAPELCPVLALPDLPGVAGAGTPEEIDAFLDAIPPYFQQALISPDRTVANLAFGIRLMPLDRQQEVIEDIRSRLDPPPGVEAELTGVPVLAAEGNAALSSPLQRYGLLVAGLAVVFLVLLAIRRGVSAAAVPLIPIVFATGWAALILFLLQVPINPMSAGLGALVIAISTEFSVLLSARYREERDAGASPRGAIERTYRSTGAAVAASGTTAIAGFAVLAVPIWSKIEMLSDFGLVTVVGLGVSLLGVMVALPAALVWSEEHGRFKARDLDPRRIAGALRAEGSDDGAGADGSSLGGRGRSAPETRA